MVLRRSRRNDVENDELVAVEAASPQGAFEYASCGRVRTERKTVLDLVLTSRLAEYKTAVRAQPFRLGKTFKPWDWARWHLFNLGTCGSNGSNFVEALLRVNIEADVEALADEDAGVKLPSVEGQLEA